MPQKTPSFDFPHGYGIIPPMKQEIINRAMRALARRRWEKEKKVKSQEEISAFFAKIGRKGAKNRWKKLSPV